MPMAVYGVRAQQALAVIRANPGATIAFIVAATGMPHRSLRNALQVLRRDGLVRRAISLRNVRMAYYYPVHIGPAPIVRLLAEPEQITWG